MRAPMHRMRSLANPLEIAHAEPAPAVAGDFEPAEGEADGQGTQDYVNPGFETQ